MKPTSVLKLATLPALNCLPVYSHFGSALRVRHGAFADEFFQKVHSRSRNELANTPRLWMGLPTVIAADLENQRFNRFSEVRPFLVVLA